MLKIEAAQVRIRTESSVTNAQEAPGRSRRCSVLAIHGYVRARPGALYAAEADTVFPQVVRQHVSAGGRTEPARRLTR
jgi:hypothetical protein